MVAYAVRAWVRLRCATVMAQTRERFFEATPAVSRAKTPAPMAPKGHRGRRRRSSLSRQQRTAGVAGQRLPHVHVHQLAGQAVVSRIRSGQGDVAPARRPDAPPGRAVTVRGPVQGRPAG